jgi:hypothetical protein
VLAAAKANLDQAETLGGITPAAEQQLLSRLSAQLQRQLVSTTVVGRAKSATQSNSATTSTAATVPTP